MRMRDKPVFKRKIVCLTLTFYIIAAKNTLKLNEKKKYRNQSRHCEYEEFGMLIAHYHLRFRQATIYFELTMNHAKVVKQ